MSQKQIVIEIYGADIQCASCVNAPSSKDTYEWLEAAILRKFPKQPFTMEYIDIQQENSDARQSEWSARVLDDEFFYPLVLIENEVIGEGYIQLKPVFAALEKHGFIAVTE